MANLNKHFKDSKGLIKGMASSNMIISGSRAPELLGITKCCDKRSDYDFYVYGSSPCVGRAMKELKNQCRVGPLLCVPRTFGCKEHSNDIHALGTIQTVHH